MKKYWTQQEVDADIKNGILEVNGDVKFECSVIIDASLKVTGDIIVIGNISAMDIIVTGNVSAWNITAVGDITAGNIIATNIIAWDISARDITAMDISARNISAWNILFYAVCFAYYKFICKSIKGRRRNSKYFCLDSKVIIKADKSGGEK